MEDMSCKIYSIVPASIPRIYHTLLLEARDGQSDRILHVTIDTQNGIAPMREILATRK
ncbi:hypothetical protein K431DRAFT_158003 [Polychaeton citri CBS 116435]|uniref:Uncharacterized protein n=1 Tax=Polychaeton citri CBS 116435 TaxID=1314669 RepID=A0A9P4UJ05_9PEZI|nr:hypothetical protein K431DRAFT_158003 [Polychaeton citri CBS 116435]